MEIEAKSENARLNTLVATTVLIISVFLAVEKVKDDSIRPSASSCISTRIRARC